jgi:peptidoglycan/xylan/chitin deacetylase (PgdA/CDA1 family)
VIPNNCCVLSVDDGLKSSLDVAELVDSAGVRGTFSLTMKYCRERNVSLKPDEIRQLASRGFDFGTHGVSHRALSRMPVDEIAPN